MDPYYWHFRRQFWIGVAVRIGTEMGQIDCAGPEVRYAQRARRAKLLHVKQCAMRHIIRLGQCREIACQRRAA